MRDKLNSNPIAQVGLVLVLLVAVAFMLLKGMGGGEEEEGEVAVSPEAAITAEAPVGVPGGESAAPAASSLSAITSSVPAPPLPQSVTRAYEAGKTVVLLVFKDGGIDDKLAREATRAAESIPDTAVFIVPAREIFRYAAITLGVDVDRVPALVVVRPKELSPGGPEAALTYGFQTARSVDQAVRDARYDGPTVSYHPE